MVRIVDCPYYKKERAYEDCIRCKYCEPMEDDMIYCTSEELTVQVIERRNFTRDSLE